MKKTFEDLNIDNEIYILDLKDFNYTILKGLILEAYIIHEDENNEFDNVHYNGLDYHYIQYNIGNNDTLHTLCIENNYENPKTKYICRDGDYILFIYERDAKQYIKRQINELIKRYQLQIKNIKKDINLLKQKYKDVR